MVYHKDNRGIVSIDFSCASGAALATAALGGSGGNSSGSSAGGGGGATCPASTLTCFDYQAELKTGLLLHWKQGSATSSLGMALEATAASGAASSWIGVAWTGDGKMVPSDAVIGNLPGGAAGAHTISGYDVGAVLPTTTFSVGKAATQTANGGSTVVTFARTEGDGAFPMSLTAPNALIWAFSGSASQTLDYHQGNFGYKTVSFDCSGGGSNSSSSTPASPAPAGSPPTTGSSNSRSSNSSSTTACVPSTLAGYNCSLRLSGDKYILHWSTDTSASTINLAAEVATTGWVALGFSPGGTMSPSEAAIGNQPAGAVPGGAAVASYSISGYTAADISPATAVALTATAVDTSTNGKTIVKFSRAMTKGKYPISASGETGIIWAYSVDGSQTLAYHGDNNGAATINFVTGTSTLGDGSSDGSDSAPEADASAGSNSTASSDAAGGGSGCTPSTIAGYSCSSQLSGSNYILHWKTNATTINFAAEVATAGWVALGWSDGKMNPSDAAIGNQPVGTNSADVAPYAISGYSGSAITASSAFSLAATAVESGSNGKTVVKFSRALTGGSYPINANGPTTLIWAYSADGSQSLANHGPNCGSAQIDFVSGATVASSSSSASSAFIAHGWLLAIAFGILMPTAILISRIFLTDKLMEKPPGVEAEKWEAQIAYAKSLKPMAFETHKWTQITAVLIALAGCIIAIVQSGSTGLQGTHGQLGISLMCLIFIQPLIGHFRPNKVTVNRPAWFVIHWVFGMVIVGLAWYNCYLGFEAMATKFAYDMRVYFMIFSIAIGLLGGIYLIIFFVDQLAYVFSQLRPGLASQSGRYSKVGKDLPNDV